MKKMVSVIIPTYQRPEFICDAIDSVLNQTIKNVEIIVVDDNGIGTLPQIENEKRLERYIKENQICYIPHDKNKNGAAARNTGILASNSEYLAFLDDDDCFEPTKLEMQIQLMSAEGNAACLCGFTRKYEDKDVKSVPDVEKLNVKNIFMHKIDTCAGSCLIVKKTLADELSGFDESFERQQDLEFLIRILQKTNVSIVKQNLAVIRMHKQNLKIPDLDKTTQQRIHFLNRFKKTIDAYSKKTKNEIYDTQYIEIAKVALKNHKVGSAFKWIIRTSNPIKTIVRMGQYMKDYIKRR